MAVIEVGGLRLHPQSEAADQDVQSKLIQLWTSKRAFILLAGPPGVGKTRASEDFVSEMLVRLNAPHDKESCRLTNLFPEFRTRVYEDVEIESTLSSSRTKFVWDITVLHPQYSYEDLIRGYRMFDAQDNLPRLEVREGLLGFMARVVSVMERMGLSSKYPSGCLILDEINRAPIGQLFGEALFALDRRGTPVTTPYELGDMGSGLLVPESLLLLGTMNSIDRAVSGFDFALRRRFVMVSMVPNDASIQALPSELGIARTIALELYKRVERLVLSSEQAGIVPVAELVLGQSYFLPPPTIKDEDPAVGWLAESYQFQILPTLLDYVEQGLIEFNPDLVGGVPEGEVLAGRRAIGEAQSNDLKPVLRALVAEPDDNTQD
jgi:AAA domain (dynein-related subfamily)